MAANDLRARLTLDASAFRKDLNNAVKGAKVSPDIDTKSANDKAKTAGKSLAGTMGEAFKGAFSGGIIGAAIGGGVAQAATAAVSTVANAAKAAFEEYKSLDSAINNIGTLGVEAGGLSLATFQDQINTLSKTSADTASNIANGVYNAISAGITGTEKEIVSFVETAGKVAVAGLSDTNTAVNALTSVVNAYGLGADGAEEVSNTFFAAIKAGKTSFEELNAGLANVVPAASAAGIGFDEVAATIAKLTTVGIPTSQATTQIRAAIIELQKPAKPLADALAKIGLNASNMGAELSKPTEEGGGLINVLQRLQESASASGLSMTQLFGSAEAASAALSVTGANATSALDIFAGVQKDIAGGVAGKAYESAAKSIDVQLSIVKNNVQAFFNDIFATLSPIASELFSALGDVFSLVSEAIGPTFETLKATFAGLFEKLGPVFEFIGGVLIGNLVAQFTLMQTILGELWSTIGTAVGVVFDVIKDALSPVIDVFSELFGEIGDGASGIENPLRLITGPIQFFGEVVRALAEQVLPKLLAPLKLAGEALAAIIGVVVDAGKAVAGFVGDLFGVGDASDEAKGGMLELLGVTDSQAEVMKRNAEATKESVEAMIATKNEQLDTAKSTDRLVQEFAKLNGQSERSREENERLQQVQLELKKQYPDLIDLTKTFGENLDGVTEIAGRNAENIAKVGGELDALNQRLAAVNRDLGFAVRNVAIQAVRDLSDEIFGANVLGIGGNEAARNYVSGFADQLYAGNSKAEIDNALLALQENLLNLKVTDADEQRGVLDLIRLGKEAAAEAIKARGFVEETNEKVGEGGDATAKSVEAAVVSVEDLLKEYNEFAALREQQLRETFVQIDADRFRTEESKKASRELSTQLATLEKQAVAARLFRAELTGIGLFLSSGLKLGDQEAAVRKVFSDIAGLLKRNDDDAEVLISVAVEPIRREKLDPAQLVPLETIDTAGYAIGQRLGDAMGTAAAAIASTILGATFTFDIDTEAIDALRGEVDLLTEGLKTGEVTYDAYLQKSGELSESLDEQAGFWQRLREVAGSTFDMLREDFGVTLVATVREAAAAIAEETKNATEATAAAFAIAGASIGASLLGAFAAGRNAFEALITTALDALDALVPVLVAMITGVNLASPDNIASLGVSGLVRAAGLTALLKGLVALARAGVAGFAEGGYTGDGPLSEVAGVVHRREMVMPHDVTSRERPVLDYLLRGGSSSDLFARATGAAVGKEMRAMRKDIAKLSTALDSLGFVERERGVRISVDKGLIARELEALALNGLRG